MKTFLQSIRRKLTFKRGRNYSIKTGSSPESARRGVSIRARYRARMRKYLLIGICAVFIAGSAVATVLIINHNTQMQELEEADAQQAAQYSEGSGTMDSDMLAGLRGESGSGDTKQDDQQIRIGVSIGKKDKVSDVQKGMQTQAEELVKAKKIDDVMEYAAGENLNQQVQDIRSLINHGCDVIVILGVGEDDYNVLAKIAMDEGIPVVTMDAAQSSGYTVNVTRSNINEQKYAEYVKANLTGGKVVLASDKKDGAASKKYGKALSGLFQKSPYQYQALYSADDGFTAALQKSGASALVATGGVANPALKNLVQKDAVPDIVCADATAGLVKTWYKLQNGGIKVEGQSSGTPEVSDSASPGVSSSASPSTTPKTVSKLVTAAGCKLYAGVAVGDRNAGRAVFEAAYLLAAGAELKDGESRVIDISAVEFITNETIAEYYQKCKDEEDATAIFPSFDKETVDRYFTAVKQPKAASASASASANTSAGTSSSPKASASTSAGTSASPKASVSTSAGTSASPKASALRKRIAFVRYLGQSGRYAGINGSLEF